MLTGINVTLDGDKVIIEGLNAFASGIRDRAIPQGLRRIAAGTARQAIGRLSGPAVGLKTLTAKTSGRQRAIARRPERHGGYPVARMTGNLRRLLSWLGPGQVKEGFTAGPFEAIVYDSAQYARMIHEGTGTSAKYGRRPFLDDAFEAFNHGAVSADILREEIATVKADSGL